MRLALAVAVLLLAASVSGPTLGAVVGDPGRATAPTPIDSCTTIDEPGRYALAADLRLSNRFYGAFLADGATNNTLRGNDAADNAVGLRLRNAPANRLVGNAASGNRDGILLVESDRNLVAGNRVVENRRGVSLLASDDTRLRDNEVRDNRRDFVVARGSRNNSVPADALGPVPGRT